MLEWYRELIRLRQTKAALKNFDKADLEAIPFGEEALAVIRKAKETDSYIICLFNFSDAEASYTVDAIVGNLRKVLDSKEVKWLGKKSGTQELSPSIIEAGGTIIVPALGILVYENE
jgi:hypothetical protein